ncbi:crossover junction endodeoxyribonuclease RuvC [candidate division WOR-3 bacterium]|nr:crossover junction endodeoxyribonuclease RuvC [candidate division WOR-3 bacterium]MCK4526670.1 crossover junction endodeoxyribonuclease RuvC [candidate division WOR-3 bacterium]
MRVLGVDPGLSSTGVALLEFDEEVKALYWEIISHRNEKGSKRLYQYYQTLYEIIDREKPDLMTIEKTFQGPNVQTLIRLGELRGAYLLLAEKEGLRVFEFTPREIKQSVTGSGASSKEQVRYMVKEILNITEDIPLDVSDAFGSIICYLNKKDKYAGIH